MISANKLFFSFAKCHFFFFFLTNSTFFKHCYSKKKIILKKRIKSPFFYFFKNFKRRYFFYKHQISFLYSFIYAKYMRLNSFFSIYAQNIAQQKKKMAFSKAKKKIKYLSFFFYRKQAYKFLNAYRHYNKFFFINTLPFLLTSALIKSKAASLAAWFKGYRFNFFFPLNNISRNLFFNNFSKHFFKNKLLKFFNRKAIKRSRTFRAHLLKNKYQSLHLKFLSNFAVGAFLIRAHGVPFEKNKLFRKNKERINSQTLFFFHASNFLFSYRFCFFKKAPEAALCKNFIINKFSKSMYFFTTEHQPKN
jgi:hypothetical protein